MGTAGTILEVVDVAVGGSTKTVETSTNHRGHSSFATKYKYISQSLVRNPAFLAS